MPFGGEVLVPGAPFQKENGYLGMWNWEKQVKPVPKDQTPEAQKALRAAFDAERKKFDVEAQQQGFSSAEARGLAEKEKILAEKTFVPKKSSVANLLNHPRLPKTILARFEPFCRLRDCACNSVPDWSCEAFVLRFV